MQENVAFVVIRLIQVAIERHGRNDPRKEDRHRHSNQSAGESQHQSFEQKLYQDVPWTRSQSFPQPNLARALCHRNQHDVHHANTTDTQCPRPNQYKHRLQSQRESVNHSAIFNRVPLRRCLFVLGIEVMAAGHNFPNRNQRLLVQLRSCGLENDHVRVANIFQIAKNLERNKTVAVVGPHVHRILNLIAQHADDFEIQAADAYVLSNRGRALKYFLVCIVPQDHYPAMFDKIALVEVAAIVDVEPAHLTIGHFHASYLHRDHPCAHFESEVTI